MTDLDNEFERFKIKLLESFNADLLSNELQAEIHKLLQDPRLRESFVRSVFANDQKLPDVQNIRARLRKR